MLKRNSRTLTMGCMALTCTLFATTSFAQPSPTTEVTWQVVNRFPLFLKDVYFARIAGIRTTENPSGDRLWNVNGSAGDTVDTKGFTQKLRDVFPVVSETAWQPVSGTYAEPELMRTRNSIVAQSSIVGQNCQWELKDLMAESITKRVDANCAYSPALPIDITKTYELRLLDRNGLALLPATRVKTRSRLVVAMGDSFASGEGNPDHPAILGSSEHTVPEKWMILPIGKGNFRLKDSSPTNGARWLDDACHRSLMSWPALTALRRAVMNPHEVVQFASFACSGAEVYDGILTRQENPPGAGYALGTVDRVNTKNTRLRHSQISSLAHLVCEKSNDATLNGIGGEKIQVNHSTFFKKVYTPQCTKVRHQVDDLLLMVGGNDAGFSSIVMWVLHPQELKIRLPFLSPILNAAVTKAIHPLTPEQAGAAFPHFEGLYSNVRLALARVGVKEESTQLALYPFILSAESVATPEARTSCTLRTADGFMPLQTLVGERAIHEGARFGAIINNLDRLKEDYITPLREAQKKNIGLWRTIDTATAFEGRGLCDTDVCEGDNCSTGDLIRWQWRDSDEHNVPWSEKSCEKANSTKQQVSYFCKAAPMRNPSYFDAYDPTRRRGLRFGNDAFLAAAGVFEKSPGQKVFRQDPITGLAHPTGNVHARIADLVSLTD